MNFDRISFSPQPSPFLLALQQSDNNKDRVAVVWNAASGKEAGRVTIGAQSRIAGTKVRRQNPRQQNRRRETMRNRLLGYRDGRKDLRSAHPFHKSHPMAAPVGFNAQGQLIASSQVHFHIFDLQQKAEVADGQTTESYGMGDQTAISPGGRFVARGHKWARWDCTMPRHSSGSAGSRRFPAK